MRVEEYRQLVAAKPPKRPKYGNRKVKAEGMTFDSAKEERRYRDLVLMQRAGDGAWRRTATAVRQSGVSQIASNVTGGGAVRDAEPFLTRMYGEAAARILEEIRRVAEGLPAALEAQYGRRFAELGIDLAVERGGAVRIIEVNIKPGKKIVRALHGDRAYADALLAPVRWARRLSDRRDCPSTGS